tara:strand:+ start:16679 stop:16918 length:240 start_codon:yes stop_codon:yes gene_type:complete
MFNRNILPIELRLFIFEFLYDYKNEKENVLKELKSFIIRQKTPKCLTSRYRVANHYFIKEEITLKPSLIKGNFKLSFSN